MPAYKSFFYILCLACIGCNNNKNPYENNLGIEQSLIAAMDTAHYTIIEWKDTLQNFGTIIQGDSAHVKIQFKNAGEIPLFILGTHVTCGCTVTAYSKDAVMPGKEGFIDVSFKANKETGEMNKKIVVITNTKKVRAVVCLYVALLKRVGNK